MKRVNAFFLMLLVILSFLLTPQTAFAAISSSQQNESSFKNESTFEPKNMQASASLSLLLWTAKDTYYRRETVLATTRFLNEGTPILNASVISEVVFPDDTSWFTLANTTNEKGLATFLFLLPSTKPTGEYTVYATAYKPGLGNASATARFEVLNEAPEIHSVEIDPQIVEQPTTVLVQVNATDFEDGTNIHVKSIVSIPNGTVQQLNMTFDGTFFTLNYPIQSTDPTGNYTVIVVARDTEGALASSDFSFQNAIIVNRGTVQGTVTDKSESPIFNATLTLRRVDSYLIYRESTDADGNYAFNQVLPGSYVLEASAKDFATNSTSVEVIGEETTTANLTLLLLPVVFGYVNTKTGTPISNVFITVFSIRGTVGSSYTNESGFYRVTVSNEGTFSIKASAHGYAPNSSIITVYLESVTQMNFTLEENGIVTGQIKDLVSGLPIPNATVYLGKQVYLGTPDFTDQHGNFSFLDILPEDYVVRATARDYMSNSSFITVVAGETTLVELGLMPTGNITGTIRDSDTGTLIDGAKVALINEFGRILALYITNVNGSYLLELVKPGNYSLKAYAYGYNSTTVSVQVKPHETSIVDFDLVSNTIFVDLHIHSSMYSRGETIQFTVTVTNPLGESVAENITNVQLVLMGPSNETISIIMSKNNATFAGNHTIPPDANIGVWIVVANVTDIHGNVGENIKFISIRETFYIRFTTDRKSYISAENVTFYAIIARYSNLSHYLNEQDVNVTLRISDKSNNTLAEFSVTTENNIFSGTYPLTGFNVGNYTAFLTVDDGGGNTITSRTLFEVVYDFSVSVHTNKLFYNRTETVNISGSANYETLDPVANTPVKIRLEVKGYARIFSTTTDDLGYFEYNFVPLGFDAGNYTLEISIIANGIERNANSTFAILGLFLKPSKITVKMSMNSANNLSISIGNIGETTLTGINGSITPSFNEVNATVVVPPNSSLTPGQWTSLTVNIASGINTPEKISFNLAVSIDQGAVEYCVINVNLYPATPVAGVYPQIIDVTLTPDSYSLHQINVTNIGYGQMINVQLTEPSLPWIFTTQTDLENIVSQKSRVFDIIITPPSNLSLGVYEDQITIISDNHVDVNIYLIITITSLEKGSLLFHVLDDVGNSVPDADILLQYQEYYLDTLSGKTNTTGYLLFTNMTVGRYSYLVSKEGYDSTSGVTTTYPGKPTKVEVLLPIQIIEISFTVDPINITDQYIITLNLTFQAEIPPPILLPIPSVLQHRGDRAYIFDNGYLTTSQFSIFNTGLIAVSDIVISVYYSYFASGYHLSFFDIGETIHIDAIEAKGLAQIPLTLSIDPGILITNLPFGLIGKIKIQGNFIYFDPGSDVPRTAITKSEVLVYMFDTGARKLCVDPWAIHVINREGMVDLTPGSWPERLPDVTITNCANMEEVYVYDTAVGGGVTLFAGFDLAQIIEKALTGEWLPIDLGAFIAFGIITRYGGLSGEEITLIDAEDTFGQIEVGFAGGPAYSILAQLLKQVLIRDFLDEFWIGRIDLLPGESAILQSEMWDVPHSWLELFRDLIGFRIRLGVGVSIGGILFSYQWEHDILPSFYLVPILIVDIYLPHISIPLPSGPGGIGGLIGPGGIGYGGYVFNPPSVIYEDRPVVERVDSIPVETIHETVKLSISQRATLERDAFLATLTMKNKLVNTPIESVDIDLQITHKNGTDAADNFFITPPNLENINAIDGTGIINPALTAITQWTIIPKPQAGGENDTGIFYFVQAFITYTVNGTQLSVNSTIEMINVKPQPLLDLDYYIPSEVKGNVPFKLAVKVTNIGNGTARNFEIETAQPVIYDNIAGLLISFKIIGSAMKGEPAGNSLKINFGDIPPGTSVIAYWLMVSSLDGVFLNFTASFTHTNELGGAETSLIQAPIYTHILMRDVMTDDTTFLFLIDANNDGTPDELIDPVFGDDTPVVDVDYTVKYTVGTMIVQTQKYEGSWIWVDVDDPYNNQRSILQINRSDGKILHPMNYWMANGKIYFVDDPEESYTIVYAIHDVAILGIVPSSTILTEGDTLTIYVDSANEGTMPETFNVTVTVNSTEIGDQQITLDPNTTTTLQFEWDTHDIAVGNYTVSATASPVLHEINLSDNTLTDGIVQIVPSSELTVIIDQTFVSDSRTDVNNIEWIGFHAKWSSNESQVIGGIISVNGTGYITNQTGWINIEVNSGTVGKGIWTVTNVSCNGINTFEQIVSDPWIIWDRVQITLTSLDARVSVGTNATIAWVGTYEYDSTPLSGSIALNDTASKDVIGKYGYTVQNIQDTEYSLTTFTSNSIHVIFDRVSITLSVEDSHIDVETMASVVWVGFYEYDLTIFSGTVMLNDTNLVKTTVGRYGFTPLNIIDPLHGLTVFTSNEVYCIWNRVNIQLTITDGRIDVGSNASLSWVGVYEYDGEAFSGTVTYNDTLTKDAVNKYSFSVSTISDPLYDLTAFSSNSVHCIFDRVSITVGVADDRIDVGSQALISWYGIHLFDGSVFEGDVTLNNTQTIYNNVERHGYTVVSIYDPLYGLTSFETNEVACVWDRVVIFEGGVSRPVTNITQSETVWFKAKYEYDNTTLDGTKGTLYVNGSTMTWSETDVLWERIYGYSTVGNRTFAVSSVLDSQYGLTTLDDAVGSLSIKWVKYVVYIPTPEQIEMSKPFVINATEIVNATIIIGNISAPTMIQVTNVTLPSPPRKGFKATGKPIKIDAKKPVKGHFRIRIHYSDEQLQAEDINEKTLKINVWNGTQWIPIATSHVNPAKNYVEAVITHFSVFLLVGESPTRPSHGPPFEWVWLSILIVTAITSFSLILFFKRRKPRNTYNIPGKQEKAKKTRANIAEEVGKRGSITSIESVTV